MKHKIVPLLAISFISLTSCNFFSSLLSVSEEVGVYNLDKIKSGDDIEKAHDITINARFKETEPLIPYLTLKQYASLYESHFADDVESNITKSATSVAWTIYRGEDLYFLTEIDFASKRLVIGGALDATFKEDDSPRDLRSLTYGAITNYDGKYLSGNGFAFYSFVDYQMKYFSYHNDYYISLGFLDMTFSSQSSIYFYYNYNRIVSSEDVENFDNIEYKVNGNKTTTNQEMKDAVSDKEIMPTYLRKYNANLFLYFLDNFYGLKDEKGIKSAVSYTKKINTYNNLFSIDNDKRVQAIADSLSYLDDNHTALISGSVAWNEDSFNRWTYGDGVKKRSQLNAQLTNKRTNAYIDKALPGAGARGGSVLYSSDNKTAMYAFDNFTFGTSSQVFNKDGSIREDAYLYDTFLDLVKTFTDIKNKGGVENVILDISLNGGGTVGVMMKLLSLISKDNKSSISYLEASTQELALATTKIDINNDKVTDLDDCFGDDFNIFIMTSDCSFSAANAFACTASYTGICKTIGQTSGGGECAVGIHYLPNGQYLYHSSSLHLGYYSESNNQFIGFESGAAPTFEITNLDNFYNIEFLNQNIANLV